MLSELTHYVLWITWRGLQCEAALGLVHPYETTLQIVPIHEDCVVVEVITTYTIFVDELLEYPPNDEVMKLGQAQGYQPNALRAFPPATQTKSENEQLTQHWG
jgi:hypothetical protein